MTRKITRPKLILTEGKDGKELSEALLEFVSHSDNFQVMNLRGKDNIPKKMRTLSKSPGFRNLTDLCVIRDADEYPDRAFQSVHDAMQRIGVEPPEEPFRWNAGPPRSAIAILPDGRRQGAIEDVFLRSVRGTHEMRCVNGFFDCVDSSREFRKKDHTAVYLAAKGYSDKPLGTTARASFCCWDLGHNAFAPLRELLSDL